MSAIFRIAALNSEHGRADFSCGSEPLDRYLREQVMQDIRRRVTSCFVASPMDSTLVAGYYTLASTSVALTELPPDIARRLPRHPTVPAVRLGRLAVATEFQGHGLGAALLADTLARAIRSDIAAYAMIVDAKDATAAAFYAHHGFIALGSRPNALFLPLKTAERLLSEG